VHGFEKLNFMIFLIGSGRVSEACNAYSSPRGCTDFSMVQATTGISVLKPFNRSIDCLEVPTAGETDQYLIGQQNYHWDGTTGLVGSVRCYHLSEDQSRILQEGTGGEFSTEFSYEGKNSARNEHLARPVRQGCREI